MTYAEQMKDRVYYSQNREDIILESFFTDVKDGFYIDVGANHPEFHSVTKLFYDKGWRGINIEPIKRHYELLKKARPKDINLNIGISDKAGTLNFNELSAGDGLSTFSTDMMSEYKGKEDNVYKDVESYKVDVKTLKQVCDENKVSKIHFLKVDVEGFEYEVLAGNDWKLYRPEVICIEANHIVKDWRPLLKKNSYELAFSDGLNDYYVDGKTDRIKKFDYVNNIVLKKDGGLKYTDIMHVASIIKPKETEINKLESTISAKKAEIEQLEHSYKILSQQHHDLSLKLVASERALRRPTVFIKYQLRRLHHLFIRLLSNTKAKQEYTESEKATLKQTQEAIKDGNGKDIDKHMKTLAKIETQRLKRLNTDDKNPVLLEFYLKAIAVLKNLKQKLAR